MLKMGSRKDCKQYDSYHIRFPRIAMQFKKFNKMFGTTLPSLKDEMSIRAQYTHDMLLGRAAIYNLIGDGSVVRTNNKSNVTKSTTGVCNQSVHRFTDKSPIEDTASRSLFVNTTANHAIRDTTIAAPQDKPTFSDVFKLWSVQHSKSFVHERGYLCKKPPLKVHLDDIESVNLFIDSISFNLNELGKDRVTFASGKSIASGKLVVRVGKGRFNITSVEVKELVDRRMNAKKIVWL